MCEVAAMENKLNSTADWSVNTNLSVSCNSLVRYVRTSVAADCVDSTLS